MKKNLIIYGYNFKNLGDDLMFAEIINKSNYKNYYFVGDKVIPSFVDKDLKFIKRGRLMPFRWKLFADFAVIGGSVLMGASEAQESMIEQKIKWFELNKWLGGRNFIVGANLGPYKSETKYLNLLQKLSNVTDKWFVRDTVSIDLLSKIKTSRATLMPDIVMGFDVGLYKCVSEKVIAVSVTKVGKDPGASLNKNDFEKEIKLLVSDYISRGYRVRFLSFEDIIDLPIINNICQQLNEIEQTHVDIVKNIKDDVIKAMAKAEVLISTRFHSMVLGALLGKPQIIYSYSNKTVQFAERYGFSTCAVTGEIESKNPTATGFSVEQIKEVKNYAYLVES